MALTSTKQSSIHGKTGSDLAKIKASFDNGEHTALADFGPEAAIIYQIQAMQDEITYLRTEISSNKDKTTFPGLGTSNSTALAGDTTVISSGQASAITANTAKTGISSGQASAITANTAKVSFAGGSATTLSFGELITTTNGKGNPNTYSIVLSATKSGVTKAVTLALA
tara:strand:+ start:1851 stop:2357 length:507 start_codon:yes stop_codon:yes gene_type:complete